MFFKNDVRLEDGNCIKSHDEDLLEPLQPPKTSSGGFGLEGIYNIPKLKISTSFTNLNHGYELNSKYIL